MDQIYLIYGKVLIVDSSDSVIFFKEQEVQQLDGTYKVEWV